MRVMQAGAVWTLALGFAVGVVGSDARAEFVLQFGSDGVPGSDSFSVRGGDPFVLDFYLTQTGSEDRLDSSSTGLVNADLTFAFDGGSGVALADFTLGPGFVDDQQGNTGIEGRTLRLAQVDETLTGETGVTTDRDGVADDSVLLGQGTLAIDPFTDGDFDLSLGPSDSPFAFALANPDGFPTELTLASSTGTLSVTAIPEPGSLLALSVLAVGGVVYCQRRRMAPTK